MRYCGRRHATNQSSGFSFFSVLLLHAYRDVTGPDAGEGVYYQVISSSDPRVAVFNRMIVEYKVPVFGSTSADCHFEVILMADGTVIFQYMDMPADGA